MTDLALAVACSLAIAMIFKHAARVGLDRLSLLTANYFTAFAISLAVLDLAGFRPGLTLSLVGLFTGALFIAGFFVLALATEVAGMSLAVAVMRISVVIPFVASWIIWNEVPSPYQIAGLLVGVAAFVLISRRPRTADPSLKPPHAADPSLKPPHAADPSLKPPHAAAASLNLTYSATAPISPVQDAVQTSESRFIPAATRPVITLTLLFLIGGVIDTMMKAFDEIFAARHSSTSFMALVFGAAFVVGLALVIGQRRRPDLATVGWGVVLGAVNYGSVEFILRAIHRLSGPFVFPVNNILLVIGGALLGVVLWKETLSWTNWAGIALAAVALLLLSL